MQKAVSHALAGLIVSAVVVVYTLVLTFWGLMAEKGLSFLGLLIMVGGVALFVRRHGAEVGYGSGFGSLFSYGFKATAVMTLVLIAFNVLFYTAFPEYRELMFNVTREQMMQQPRVTEEQVEIGLSKMREFFWPILIGGTLFNAMMAGAVGSLLGAGMTSKKQRKNG